MRYLYSTLFSLLSFALYGQLFTIQGQTFDPELKKATVFIFIKDSTNNFKANGTGFFISVDVPRDTTKMVVHLATAKHVLFDKNNKLFNEIYIRMYRTTDSSLAYIKIPLINSGSKQNIFIPNDPSIDLAIMFPPDEIINYELLTIPSTFLVSKNEYKSLDIREGRDVFFVGMFPDFIGLKKNYPITRFGKVALIPDEKVFWNGYLRDLYLLETTTYWGNSGSPVYIITRDSRYYKGDSNRQFITEPTTIKLAGVMNGFLVHLLQVRSWKQRI